MTLTSKRIKLGFAALGFFSALPVVVFGAVMQSLLGAIVAASGLAFGILSASRARRIRLTVDNSGIHIVNRWRTVTVALDDFVAFEAKSAWWGMFTGSAPLLGIKVREGIDSISSLATYGMPLNAPVVQAMLDQIRRLQGGRQTI
jgi:energy-converting hydrogenase Eha subunit G